MENVINLIDKIVDKFTLNGFAILVLVILCSLIVFYINHWLLVYQNLEKNVENAVANAESKVLQTATGGGASNTTNFYFPPNLNKRADFLELFSLYGQIVLSIFILTFLSILILSGQLKAEVGIPIISGISGYTISRTTKINRQEKVKEGETKNS